MLGSQPFANPLPTFSANPCPSHSFRGPPGAGLETRVDGFQKNPRAQKNKIGTSPPQNPKPKIPPPKKTRNFMDMVFSCRTDAFFPGVHKIGAAISGPRIADTNFTDTRIFLRLLGTQKGTKTDGFQNRKFWGLSKLAALVHQQFWYPFGWSFGTQNGIKTDVFQIASSGDFHNFAILVHQQFWYPFGCFQFLGKV